MNPLDDWDDQELADTPVVVHITTQPNTVTVEYAGTKSVGRWWDSGSVRCYSGTKWLLEAAMLMWSGDDFTTSIDELRRHLHWSHSEH